MGILAERNECNSQSERATTTRRATTSGCRTRQNVLGRRVPVKSGTRSAQCGDVLCGAVGARASTSTPPRHTLILPSSRCLFRVRIVLVPRTNAPPHGSKYLYGVLDRHCANRRKREYRNGKRFLDQRRPTERRPRRRSVARLSRMGESRCPAPTPDRENTPTISPRAPRIGGVRHVALAVYANHLPAKERDDDRHLYPLPAMRVARGIPRRWRRWSLTARWPAQSRPASGETASRRGPILGPTPAEGSPSFGSSLVPRRQQGKSEHEHIDATERANSARVSGSLCGGARRR